MVLIYLLSSQLLLTALTVLFIVPDIVHATSLAIVIARVYCCHACHDVISHDIATCMFRTACAHLS